MTWTFVPSRTRIRSAGPRSLTGGRSAETGGDADCPGVRRRTRAMASARRSALTGFSR